jgi:integrase
VSAVPLPATCKRGHVGAYKLNAQGNPVCTLCAREARRASKARTTERTQSAAAESVAQAVAASCHSHKSFGEVGREYLSKRDNLAPATAARDQWVFALLAPLHSRLIDQLTTPDYVRALCAVEAAGNRRAAAHRCAGLATAITRYAVNHGYARTNALPAGQLRGTLKPVNQVSFAAITDPDRFGQLLRFARDYRLIGKRSVAAALRLAPLVFVRPGELRTAEWVHINLDKAEWVIPAQNMKMRRPHLVPLSRQALEILREQREYSGTGSYVFPGTKADRPLSENTLSAALAYFCESSEHVPHGFRSSASTMLREQLGYDSEIVELQLAHVKGDKVAAIYDRSQKLPDRRAMMQRWADYVDELRAKACENFNNAKTPKPLPSDLGAGLWSYAGETG